MVKQRTIYLDVVRVVACIMVILMHAPISGVGAEEHGPFLVLNIYLTTPCVPLFFMVSGALLLPCKEGTSAILYLRRRLGKIIGPTVCFSLFYLANSSSSVDWMISLFSLPFSVQGHGILWFMYTLAGLYLLVPILSSWVREASKRELEFYLLLWFVTLLYPYISLFLGVNTSETGVLYYFTGYVGYFLLGYYLNTVVIRNSWWVCFLGMAMFPLPLLNKILGWDLDFYKVFWFLSAPVAIMTASWFIGIKCLFAQKRLSRVVVSVLEQTNNLSFGIYLIHIFVMRTLLWNWSMVQAIGNYYLQTLIVAVLTFVGSYMICYLIAYFPFSQYIIGYSIRKK